MIKRYLKHQINRIKSFDDNKKKIELNAIYALLEGRGYTKTQIKNTIDTIIIENLLNLSERLKKLNNDLLD